MTTDLLPGIDINVDNYTFKDNKGDKWDITLTLAGCLRVDKTDFKNYFDGPTSLLKPSKEFLHAVYTDIQLMFSVMYHIMRPQMEKANISEEDFGSRIDSRALAAARDAFYAASYDFFPERKTVLLQLREMDKRQTEKLNNKLAEIMPRIEEIADKEAQDIFDEALQRMRGRKSSNNVDG